MAKTNESIFSNGVSYDVFNGTMASAFRIVEAEMQEKFNTSEEPTVKAIRNVEIEGIMYSLCEAYFDSGSEDYYYFAVN
jgi:hypothetical protein